jgi:hypothetical protein
VKGECCMYLWFNETLAGNNLLTLMVAIGSLLFDYIPIGCIMKVVKTDNGLCFPGLMS